MRPRVSFVVPVLNDAARLETCLRSISRNQYALGHIEVVVVDNGSTDGSLEVARRLGAKVVVIEHATVSELRNQGARHATGDVLAFIDADNEIVSGWVRAAIEVLQMPGVGAAGSLCRAPIDGTWVQRTYGHLRGRVERQTDAVWLGSGNLALWRHTFDAAGGVRIVPGGSSIRAGAYVARGVVCMPPMYINTGAWVQCMVRNVRLQSPMSPNRSRRPACSSEL